MADGIVQVAPDSTGKKIDASELTVGANTVERQRINIADPATAAAIVAVLNADPAGTEYGLVVRPIFDVIAAGSGAHANVSLGNSTGKVNKGSTGNLATTATTADQVITTYTVTAGKTFYVQSIVVSARLTTFATTATWFGAFSIETPSGTKIMTLDATGAGAMAPVVITFDEPLPVAAAAVIRVVCTPGAVTAYTWKGAIIGYEK